MKITAILKESRAELQAIIFKQAAKSVNRAIEKAIPNIEEGIRQLFKFNVESSPEYQSLLSGELRNQFGIEDSDVRLNTIMKIWLENVRTEYNKSNGRLAISICASDFGDVLGIGAATLTTDNGTDLHWLEWLLTEGDKTIVRDFHIVYEPENSRTDSYIMVKGGAWGVPPEFSGTIGDNFVTRALDSIRQSEITNLVKRNIKAYLA